MSLTPVTPNFASVTRRVFRDRVVFSGGASSRFASGTRRRENVGVCPALQNGTPQNGSPQTGTLQNGSPQTGTSQKGSPQTCTLQNDSPQTGTPQ